MKYAHLEKDTNKLLGWYDDSIRSVIPTPNIKVEDDVWQEAININANCYEKGKFIVKDFRTDEEIAQQELRSKINEANSYLKDTDWVNNYKLRNDLGLEVIPDGSFKWEIISKRTKYIEFLKEVN